MTTSMTNIV